MTNPINLHTDDPSPGLRKRTPRLLAATLSTLLVVGSIIALDAGAAQAAGTPAGTFTDAALTIDDDGTSPVPGDDAIDDGKVALRNGVSLTWRVNLHELENGTMTQTLPPNWSWDPTSFKSAGLDNPTGVGGYTSTYELSDANRTLTLNLSGGNGANGALNVVFPRLRAIVTDRAEQPESKRYTPELSITDATGTRVAPTTSKVKTLDVVAQSRAYIVMDYNGATSAAGGVDAEFDFGNGPEKALRNHLAFRIISAVGLGDRPLQMGDNINLTTPLTLTIDGQPWSGPFGFDKYVDENGTATSTVSGTDPRTMNIRFDTAGKTTNRFDTNTYVYIPRRLAPNLNDKDQKPLLLTVAPTATGTWKDAAGNTITDITGPGATKRSVQFYHTDGRPGGDESVAQDWAHDLYSPDGSKVLDDVRTLPGLEYKTRTAYRPRASRAAGTTDQWQAQADSAINLFTLWNPKDTEFRDPSKIQVNTPLGDLVEGTDYRLSYTTDVVPDPSRPGNPAGLSWTERSAYQGKLSDVAGVRFEWIGNNGIYAPAPTENYRNFTIQVFVPLNLTRALAELGSTLDDATVRHVGAVNISTRNADGSDSLYYSRNVSRQLYVRLADAYINLGATGFNLDGKPATPERRNIVAGETVRYTVAPGNRYLAQGLNDTNAIIKNAKIEVCFPENTVGYSAKDIDTKLWNVTYFPENKCQTVPGMSSNKGGLVVTPKFDMRADQPIPAFTVDIETSIVPTKNGGGAFRLHAGFWGDGLGQDANYGNTAALAYVDMWGNAPAIAQYEVSNSAPVIAPGDDAEFRLSWLNYQPGPSGAASFVAVLPTNGDQSGTRVNGPLSLSTATLNANAGTGSVLELTTDASIRETTQSTAPAEKIDWTPYDQATADQVTQATALRVSVGTLTVGTDGIGSLDVRLDAPQSRAGDSIRLGANGVTNLGNAAFETKLAGGTPSEVKVADTGITGSVWNDQNGDGTRTAGEPGLADVRVNLLDTTGAPILGADGTPRSVQTDANGSYRVTGLATASYRLGVDTSTLPAGEDWAFTSGVGEPISDPIPVIIGNTVADADFGFQSQTPTLSFTKSGAAPATVAAGNPIEYTFTLTNTGSVDVSQVTIDDALPGVSAPRVDAWPDPARPGTLPVGASLSASATYPITQADIDAGSVLNTAVASGTSPGGKNVTEKASATVLLSGTSALGMTLRGSVAAGDQKPGDTVSYDYAITNNGNQTLTDLDIASELPGISAITPGTWPGKTGVLAPGETVTATATLALTQQQIDAGIVTNASSATAKNPAGTTVRAAASVDVALSSTGALDITAAGSVPSGVAAAGEDVEYKVAFTNTGGNTLTGVVLDPASSWASVPHIITWPTPANPGVLKPGEQATVTFVTQLTQKQVDAGSVTSDPFTVTGTDPRGTERTATTTATIVLTPVTTVDLAATGTLEGDPAEGSTAAYDTVITNTGATTLTETELTSDLTGLGDFEFDNAADPASAGVLAPGASVNARAKIALTQDHVDAGKIVNTMTARSKTAGKATAESSASVTLLLPVQRTVVFAKTATLSSDGSKINYAFTLKNTGNVTLKKVTVSDPMTALGTLSYVWPGTAGTLLPGQTVTATAAYSITDANRGTTVVNVATATGTDPTGTALSAKATATLAIAKLPKDPGDILSLTGAGGVPLFSAVLSVFLLAGAGLLFWNRRRRTGTDLG
ncbi:hypothetical protein D9V34_03510 [Mycetocola lacteus]|uniref:Uncharacterized protein n=1 Tax=Mycetocola lacteus TaxID=76637 RepID=A0A3L7ATX4_9MICO|nr:hypothetical protein D9V34_03510 [Mycetocola lacteus]